jgi:hypothetical protein
MGYNRTEADHAVFVRYRDGVVSIIVLYVDDFTLVCEDINVILRDKEALKKAYNMTDLGELTYILGMHIMRDRKAGRIELSQQRYIEDILERYGKSDVRPISDQHPRAHQRAPYQTHITRNRREVISARSMRHHVPDARDSTRHSIRRRSPRKTRSHSR